MEAGLFSYGIGRPQLIIGIAYRAGHYEAGMKGVINVVVKRH